MNHKNKKRFRKMSSKIISTSLLLSFLSMTPTHEGYAQIVDDEVINVANPENPVISDTSAYEDEVRRLDPLEPFNRAMFGLNTFMDRLFIQHMALAYRELVPQPVKNRVSDFMNNLSEPIIFFNDVLQGEFTKSLETLTRFVFNSTFGILGLFDVMGRAGLKRKPNDFETTFRRWGIASGPYIVLPLLGPSSFRNAIGDVAAYFTDPYNWSIRTTSRNEFLGTRGGAFIYARAGVDALIKRAQLLKITEKLDKTADPYAQYRILYLQSRKIINAIEDTAVPDDIVHDSQKNN